VVLSQVIGHMVRFEASGRSATDAVPIPEVAHGLVRDVITGVRKRHSEHDVAVATKIVREATDAITSDIFLVDPDFLDAELN
jgi:hypothetical protein